MAGQRRHSDQRRPRPDRARSTAATLAVSIVSTLLIFGVAFIFGRRWLKAFDYLDDAARRVSRGDLSPLEPHPMPTAEMEHLQQTVSGMITNLQGARQSIAAQVDDERRMREELQSLQQQVIRQERLAAIGVLVSGVAHELNNPLQAILGFAELLQMQKDMPESARADLTLDPEGEHARQRHHPQPVAVRPADVGADAGEAARRGRLGDGTAAAQARGAEHPRRGRTRSRWRR